MSQLFKKLNSNSILILLFSLFALNSTAFSHKQRTHQYITKQAYALLRLYLNADIPVISQRIGNVETGGFSPSTIFVDRNPGKPWMEGKIATGAFREDEEDIVYKIGDTDYLSNAARYLWASVSHFWYADNGNDFPTNLAGFTDGPYPNAYQKMTKLAYGGYDLIRKIYVRTLPTHSDGSGSCAAQFAIVHLNYNSLTDLYKNKNIYVKSVIWSNGDGDIYNTPVKLTPSNFSELNDISLNDWIDLTVFEILGRMAHLLGDMSVPAHVHNDSHANGESYESKMSSDDADEYISQNQFATYWNANLVWSNFQSIMNPYVSYDPSPIHHLMYTMNQLADHFPSIASNGNNNFDQTNLELLQYFPYNVSPTTQAEAASLTEQHYINIRNSTFPHVIRATAGLFYWFAIEAGLTIRPFQPIVAATISGANVIIKNKVASWGVSSTTEGKPPYHYQWYRMLSSNQLAKGINPDGLPSETWVTCGLNQDYLELTGSETDSRNMCIKCEVRDAFNTTVTSNTYYVEYSATDIPPTQPSIVKPTVNENSLSNFPNPFNPVTKISYSVKENGLTKVQVFDILGNKVADLVSEYLTAGSYVATFDASNLPSGIYLYSIRSNNYSAVKKMLLVK